MTSDPRAFFAVDAGTATTAVGLIGRYEGRWRLLGATAFPAGTATEAILELLAGRVRAADPELALAVGLPPAGRTDEVPRLEVSTRPAPILAVLAATRRALGLAEPAALATGWRIASASLDHDGGDGLTRLILRRDITTVLVAAGDPAGGDERGAIAELSAIVAAAAARRPELRVVLAGVMAEAAPSVAGRTARRLDDVPQEGADGRRPGPGARTGPAGASAEPSAPSVAPAVPGAVPSAAPGPGAVDPLRAHDLVLAPAATVGHPPGSALRSVLDRLRGNQTDSRRAIVRSAATLAAVLDRRIEVVEIGHEGGLRAVATPMGGGGSRVSVRSAIVAAAALVPADADPAMVDAVMGWSTVSIDRHRLRDRLRELWISPWAEARGEGALLRLAAARVALERLIATTPDLSDGGPPDVVLVAGGPFAVAPGPAIALAVSDVLRRPGASQITYDHARLLGPLGAIEDPAERRTIIADLADDLLAPLGSVIVATGLRPGRSAGRLVVHATAGRNELDLMPGTLELVDLPPGETAIAEFQFRDSVVLGTRGRHFAVDVGGGLGGLILDLRGVPLRLPDRPDRRRELLDTWQRVLWVGLEA